MFFERKNGLYIGRFGSLLQYPNLVHGISTRKGGVSMAPYDSLNCGLNTEDNAGHVRENRRRFFDAVHLDENLLVVPEQVHGDHVRVATSSGAVSDTDAVVTRQTALFLSVQVADCLPVFLVDPVRSAVGLVHAGWRSSAKRITFATVLTMNRAFQSNSSDLVALLGPSIGPCCYSVGEETADQFDLRYFRGGRLDLWQCNMDQLLDAGLKQENIVQSRLCTVCHPEWFYSHRASEGKTGRMLAVLGYQ